MILIKKMKKVVLYQVMMMHLKMSQKVKSQKIIQRIKLKIQVQLIAKIYKNKLKKIQIKICIF